MNPLRCVETSYRLPLKVKNRRFISDWKELGEALSPVNDKHAQRLGTEGTEGTPKPLKELLLHIMSPTPEVPTFA